MLRFARSPVSYIPLSNAPSIHSTTSGQSSDDAPLLEQPLPARPRRNPPLSILNVLSFSRRPAQPAHSLHRYALPEGIQYDNLDLPDNISQPTNEQVQVWLDDLSVLSSELKQRKSLGVDLHFHRPTSEQYQYLKHQMNLAAREQLTAVLKEVIKHEVTNGRDTAPWTQLYLDVQHARLRTHTPADRSAHRRGSAIFLAIGVGTYGLAFTDLDKLRAANREYHRGETRPEYARTFNDMMGMLRAPNIAMDVKREIARRILDDFIGKEKLFTRTDANRIYLALWNGPLPLRYRNPQDINNFQGLGSKVLPGPSTIEQQNSLIAWASNPTVNSNHLPASQTRNTSAPAMHHSPVQQS